MSTLPIEKIPIKYQRYYFSSQAKKVYTHTKNAYE